MKKCIECEKRIARYWKDLERANFCYECFAVIMGGEKHELPRSKEAV